MTGQEWLRHAFDPALGTVNPAYEKLRAELERLSESGQLSQDEARRTRMRLDQDQRERRMIVRGRTERVRSEAKVEADQDCLDGLLTLERPLGEVDGITIVVTRVEMWASRLILRVEGVQNQLTDALDTTYDTEWKAWERRWVEDRAAAEAEDLPPPEQPSVPRLSGLPLSVADDVGTRYHATGGAIGGSEHPWRSELRLEPGVPPSARVLRIALEDGEPERERLEFALPSRT